MLQLRGCQTARPLLERKECIDVEAYRQTSDWGETLCISDSWNSGRASRELWRSHLRLIIQSTYFFMDFVKGLWQRPLGHLVGVWIAKATDILWTKFLDAADGERQFGWPDLGMRLFLRAMKFLLASSDCDCVHPVAICKTVIKIDLFINCTSVVTACHTQILIRSWRWWSITSTVTIAVNGIQSDHNI